MLVLAEIEQGPPHGRVSGERSDGETLDNHYGKSFNLLEKMPRQRFQDTRKLVKVRAKLIFCVIQRYKDNV
jgi:hypothetical protein